MQEAVVESNEDLLSDEEIEYPILEIEEPEYCKVKVKYQADPELVKEKIDEAISTLKKVKISGFRKGKAPLYAIKSKLKPQIDNFVARSMASQAVEDVQFETGIKIVGQPIFSDIKLISDKFECGIELWKKPEFELGNLKFDIPKPEMKHDADQLAEKALMDLRMRVGDVSPYEEDDSVEIGDNVTFSFTATIDGEEVEGLTKEGEMYQIGTNKWNGFDDYLIGMKAGENREFDFVFDETSPEELSGKTAKFNVQLHMGTKRKPHPLDDEFCKKMQVENIEDVLTKLKSISEQSIKRNEINKVRDQAAIKLVNSHDFEVPQFMIDSEAKATVANHGVQDISKLTPEELESVNKKAKDNVKLSFILDSVMESEPDSVLNDNEARGKLFQMLSSQGHNVNELAKDPAFHGQFAKMIDDVKKEFALQWVADNSNIIE